MHSLPGHVRVYRCERRQASNLLAAAVSGSVEIAGTRLALDRNSTSSLQMKTTVLSVMVGLLLVAGSGSAQNPAAQNEQRLLTLVQDVQAQQAQIAANQEKLDSKLAEVSEAVRLARIFAGRGGK